MDDDLPDDRALEALDDRSSARLNRREFLAYTGAALAASACGDMPQSSATGRAWPEVDASPNVRASRPPNAPSIPDDAFSLGVASGDPRHDRVVLWTRLAPEPTQGGGMPDVDVPVVWEIARDEEFEQIVGSGWLMAQPAFAHSVHVDVQGLQPDTWYWYRFRVGDQQVSAKGQTRTMPRPGASPDRLRLATASCQNYEDGYYTAHAHLAEEDVDLVAFLGDYIYEYSGSDRGVRRHDNNYLSTLGEFRNRYGLYKSDPNLQAAHENCPWILTWDDHEVRNNYAGANGPGSPTPDQAKRLRAAAYQAYFEHMPLRVPFPKNPSNLDIYRTFSFGDLADLFVLDGRQYRSPQACNGEIGNPCEEIHDPDRTMLGDAQQRWLVDQMYRSNAHWKAVAQQTVFSPLTASVPLLNPDQWDGYQNERQALLQFFGRDDVSNVTVLTGDIHTAAFFEMPVDDDDPESSVVGHEIVATSITSGGGFLKKIERFDDTAVKLVDPLKYLKPKYRGYCLLDYTRERCKVRYRAVSTIEQKEAEISTDHTVTIESES
jgi:alkaline phosphatase D